MSGAGRGVRGWISQLWADVKASTDAGWLSVLRFFGLLYGSIDRELPIDQAFRKSLRRRLPGYVGWGHALGGITYVLFLLLVVTGVLLAVYYRPSAQEAYPSVRYLVSEVPLGWLVRDLHVWSANLIVVALLAHMARVFFAGAYKPPRETSWVVGLLLFFVVLTFGATGYLLPWDQWAYWTVTEALEALAKMPALGAGLASLLMGDAFVSGATLSRFFALHVIVLPWIAFALLAFHFAVVRRHGPAPPEGVSVDRAGLPFFPHHLLRSFLVAVWVVTLAITLALLFPRPIGDPATPFHVPRELVSAWIVVDVTLALIRYLGAWGLAAFTALGVALALLPIFDRGPERRLRRRPFAAALGLVFFATFAIAWLTGRQLRSVRLPETLRPRSLEERVTPPPPPPSTTPQPEIGVRPIRPEPRSDTPRGGGARP